MSAPTDIYEDPPTAMPGEVALVHPPEAATPNTTPAQKPAPGWLQRMSLFVLVLFCVYLGVLVMVLPWWTRLWDGNAFVFAHPALSVFLHNGVVRGVISGIGMVDIWIGVSEAIHYRDYRG